MHDARLRHAGLWSAWIAVKSEVWLAATYTGLVQISSLPDQYQRERCLLALMMAVSVLFVLVR